MKIMNLLLGLIIFTACSEKKLNYTTEEVNGIKVYKNSNIPAVPGLKIELKELFTIKGYDESFAQDSLRIIQDIGSIAVDSVENIYILSMNRAKVSKFDSKGEFIKSFGRMGDGPGESKWPQNMYVQNDTVNVLNQTVLHMNKFDTDGNFLSSVPTNDCKMPVFTKPFGKDRIVTYFCNWRYEDEGMFMDYDLGIADAKYYEVKRIKKQTFEGERVQTEYIDLLFGFASSNGQLYVADNSTDRYHIDAFDQSGNLLYSIEKPFRKIKMPAEYSEASKGKILYRKAVTDLLTDADGRLWSVVPSETAEDKNVMVDIFKVGVFLNRVKLDIGVDADDVSTHRTMVINGRRLYISDLDNTEVRVYEYEVTEN
ncbi:MAG TPA: 6-bladed beta-propeller [Clostridiales bacterium]|nr:6-bladed beta-propeller [Clostridiales bacterium]